MKQKHSVEVRCWNCDRRLGYIHYNDSPNPEILCVECEDKEARRKEGHKGGRR